MENTNCGDECPFVKTGFCKSDCECPNFMQSCWQEGKTGETKFIKDCIPKRLMIQNNMHQIRIEGLQQALEQQRNTFIAMGENFNLLMIEVQKALTPQNNLLSDVSTQNNLLPSKLDRVDSPE